MDTNEYPFIVTKFDCFTYTTTRALMCKDIIFENIKIGGTMNY